MSKEKNSLGQTPLRTAFEIIQNTLFNDITIEMEKNNAFQKVLAKAYRTYRLRPYKIKNLTPLEIREMYAKMQDKVYQRKTDIEIRHCWSDNELRIFLWIAIGLSFIRDIDLQHFGEKQVSELCHIFGGKDQTVVQFQLKLLQKCDKKGQKWSSDDDAILGSFIRSTTSPNRWNLVAKKIYSSSNKQSFKSPKQCRERWMNHLKPSIKKEGWLIEEDVELFEHFLNKGKKWATIARLMNDKRTEHSVKNRFNSLMKPHLQKEEDPEETAVAYRLLVKLKKVVSKNQKNQNLKETEKMEEMREEQGVFQEQEDNFQFNGDIFNRTDEQLQEHLNLFKRPRQTDCFFNQEEQSFSHGMNFLFFQAPKKYSCPEFSTQSFYT